MEVANRHTSSAANNQKRRATGATGLHLASGDVTTIPLNRCKNSIYRPLLGAAFLLSTAGSAAHAQTFTNIVDPLNPTFTQALGINDAGTIAGYGNATIFNGFTGSR